MGSVPAAERKRYFVLKGCAGLGNRLFTLSSVIEYVLATGRTLLVDWSEGECAPRGENPFHEYFQLTGIDQIRSFGEIPGFENLTKYPAIWGRHPEKSAPDLYEPALPSVAQSHLFRFLPRKYRGRRNGYWRLLPQYEDRERSLLHASDYPRSLPHDVVFGADFAPPFRERLFNRHVAIRPEVLERFERIARELGVDSETVGVQVRATDIRPMKGFDHLDSILAGLGAGRRIFLATDNLQVRQDFRRRHPNSVGLDRFLHPDTELGLHSWVVVHNRTDLLREVFETSLTELWLLSRCGTIVHQGISTFSRVARAWARPGQLAINWDGSGSPLSA